MTHVKAQAMDQTANQTVLVHEAAGIMRIHLNRPEKKNALTQAMYHTMNQALLAANTRTDEIAAVLITGAGETFCAGNDLADFLRQEELTATAPVFQFLTTLATIQVPVVAAVQGHAIGIGTTLLLHCDLVYAADNAQFALPFVNLGLVPEAASSQLLPLLCGHVKAAELLLLGEPFSAARAEQLNVVNQVLPASELEKRVEEVIQALAVQPKASLREAKRLLKTPIQPVPERIALELKSFLALLASPATQARIAAIKNK